MQLLISLSAILCFSILAGVSLLRLWLSYQQRNVLNYDSTYKYDKNSIDQIPKRFSATSIHNYSKMLFGFGLMVSSALVLFAFTWQTEDQQDLMSYSKPIMEEEIFDLPPITDILPPPPPKVRIVDPSNHIEVDDIDFNELIEINIEDPQIDISDIVTDITRIDKNNFPLEEVEEIFEIVEEPAAFKGGMDKFYQYVSKNLNYPKQARRQGVEGKIFLQFIIDTLPDKDEKMQIMYGINGEKTLTEETLDHLSGYKNSSPVRIGNAAYIQRQNDIYGILMEVIYQQFLQFETTLDNSEELWMVILGIVKIVKQHWKEADKGIWELRTEDRHFTFSKLLCWVAIDRAIKIACVLERGNLGEWEELRKEIHDDICRNAWSEEKQAYTQSYGSKDLDAGTLLMEQYGFLDAKDPRYISTVQATERELCKDGLMYRYRNNDDFGEPNSSFTICTFWLIDSLYKIGEEEKAIQYFDQLLSYSNHLGLFSEDIDFKTKRLLGNFPQAYSHLALIETTANFSKNSTKEDRFNLIVY